MNKKKRRDVAALAATGTGRAALMGLDLEDPDTHGAMYQPMVESPTCPDPIRACHALIASIEADWPGHTFTVVANERAKYLAWRVAMTTMLGPGTYPPKEYAEARL